MEDGGFDGMLGQWRTLDENEEDVNKVRTSASSASQGLPVRSSRGWREQGGEPEKPSRWDQCHRGFEDYLFSGTRASQRRPGSACWPQTRWPSSKRKSLNRPQRLLLWCQHNRTKPIRARTWKLITWMRRDTQVAPIERWIRCDKYLTTSFAWQP